MRHNMRIGFLLCVGMATNASAQYATFARDTDTIQVSGHTTLGTRATYEAVVRPAAGTAEGVIWNEWQDFAEDKQLGLAGTGVYGYSHFLGSSSVIFGGSMTPGEWHHVAYVYDGAEERLYVDGQRVAFRAAAGNIGDGLTSLMAVGALRRQSLYTSLRGDLESLRVSSVARYTGVSFVPTIGDLPSDADTLILYNFNDPPGTPDITDESGNGHSGTLGVGFPGATSPTFPGCPGDFNDDGFVTGDDFDAYVVAFIAGNAEADFNADGFVTGDDFDLFVLAFTAGC